MNKINKIEGVEEIIIILDANMCSLYYVIQHFLLSSNFYDVFTSISGLFSMALKKLVSPTNKHNYDYFIEWMSTLENFKPPQQRCLLVDMTSRRGATPNQHWMNVVYFNIGIYNVEKRRINVVEMTISKQSKKKSFQIECSELKVLTYFSKYVAQKSY